LIENENEQLRSGKTETSFPDNVHAKEFVMLPIYRAQNLLFCEWLSETQHFIYTINGIKSQ